MEFEYIALTGPMYSGKSTIARKLSEQGYMLINFTDTLKAEAVKALAAVGVHISIDYIHQSKGLFRPFLQELGTILDFDRDPKWVNKALEEWLIRGRPRVVFDNVRTAEQFLTLKWYGFQLVEVRLQGILTQASRASKLGVTQERLAEMLNHPIEAGVGRPDLVSLYLDGTDLPEENVRLLMNAAIPSN